MTFEKVPEIKTEVSQSLPVFQAEAESDSMNGVIPACFRFFIGILSTLCFCMFLPKPLNFFFRQLCLVGCYINHGQVIPYCYEPDTCSMIYKIFSHLWTLLEFLPDGDAHKKSTDNHIRKSHVGTNHNSLENRKPAEPKTRAELSIDETPFLHRFCCGMEINMCDYMDYANGHGPESREEGLPIFFNLVGFANFIVSCCCLKIPFLFIVYTIESVILFIILLSVIIFAILVILLAFVIVFVIIFVMVLLFPILIPILLVYAIYKEGKRPLL